MRSTSSPTCPERRTTGAQRQMNIAAIAKPPPIPSPDMCFAWRPSATRATPSPSAESPIAAESTRRSRSRTIPAAVMRRVFRLAAGPSIPRRGLERIGREAPGRRRVPEAEGEAGRAERRGGRRDGSARPSRRHHRAEPRRHDRHRDRREEREHEERGDGHLTRRDRCEEQDADTRAAAHPVDQADPEGRMRRTDRMVVIGAVLVGPREGPVAPSHEQADREEHDQRGDRGLRTPLDGVGEVALGDQDGDAEGCEA